MLIFEIANHIDEAIQHSSTMKEEKNTIEGICRVNSLEIIFILDLTNTVDQQQYKLLLSLEMIH